MKMAERILIGHIKGERGPQGEQGPAGADGTSATIAVGKVTTGDTGTNAEVTNVGTENAAIFDFVIPKGDKGNQGDGGEMVDAPQDGKIYGRKDAEWKEVGSITPGIQSPEFIVPFHFYMHKSQNMEIYYNCAQTKDIDWNRSNISMTYQSNAAYAYSRKLVIGNDTQHKSTSYQLSDGFYRCNVEISDCDNNILDYLDIVFQVLDDGVAPSTPYKVLVIGDSNTTGSPNIWGNYLQTLGKQAFNTENEVFEFVGTQGSISSYSHEGRASWSSQNYNSNKSGNPFWDATNEKISAAYYTQETGITPDIVFIWLGTNDIGGDKFTQNEALDSVLSLKSVAEMALEWENAVVIVGCHQRRSGIDGVLYNNSVQIRSEYELRRRENLYYKTFYENIKPSNRLYIAPLFCTFDKDNNYSTIDVPANPFLASTEHKQITDHLHPIASSKNQIMNTFFGCWFANRNPMTKGAYHIVNLLTDPLFESIETLVWKAGSGNGNYGFISVPESGVIQLTDGVDYAGALRIRTTVSGDMIIDKHKYYVSGYLKSNNHDRLGFQVGNAFVRNGVRKIDEWIWISGVVSYDEITNNGATASQYSFYYMVECWSLTTEEKAKRVVQFKEPMLIDLTATFGEGKEPPVYWCDEHLFFFDGDFDLVLD